MQFSCESCKATLAIADEKVKGKRLIVRCKRCGAKIQIADPALGLPATLLAPGPAAGAAAPARPTQPGPAPGAPAASAPAPAAAAREPETDTESTRAMDSATLEEALRASKVAAEEDVSLVSAPTPAATKAAPTARPAAAAATPTPAGGMAPVASHANGASFTAAAAAASSAPPSELWFAMLAGKQTGPLTRAELALKIAQGQVVARTYLWRDGMAAWQRAQDVAEVAALLPGLTSAEKKPTPPPMSTKPAPSNAVRTEGPFDEAGTIFGDKSGSGRRVPDEETAKPTSSEGALDLARWASEELGKRSPSKGEMPAVAEGAPQTQDAGQAPASGDGPRLRSDTDALFRQIDQGRGRGMRFLLVLLILGGIAACAYYFLYLRGGRSTASATSADGSKAAEAAKPAPPPAAPAPQPTDGGPQGAATDGGVGAAAIARPPEAELHARIDAKRPEFNRCVQDAAKRGSPLKGGITLLLTIQPTGAVSEARADRRGGEAGPAGECLRKVAKGLSFPSFSGPPFDLQVPVETGP